MKIEFGYLFGMALQTVPEPRKVARDLFALNLSQPTLWKILWLILVLMAFFGVASGVFFPVDPEDYGPLMSNPLAVSATEAAVGVATVFGIHYIGRAVGGQGRFADALMTVIWLHFVALLIEVGVIVLGLFAPGLALVLWGAGFVMTFWILTQFTTELHGFRSAGMVFFGTLMVLLVFVVVVSTVAMLLGFGGPVGTEGI